VSRLRALVTAPLRGAGLDKLRQLVDVVYDPWIEQTPLRIYSAEQLAEQISSHAADVVVVESDSVAGPVFELGLRAIASTRGDPNNVDVTGATLMDSSGLSVDDRLTAKTLDDVIGAAAGSSQPTIRPLLDLLPIAGGSGTPSNLLSQISSGTLKPALATMMTIGSAI